MQIQSPPELKTIAEEWQDITFDEIRNQPKETARAIFRNWTSFCRQRGTLLARKGDE